jgi:uncharacterized membrane protein
MPEVWGLFDWVVPLMVASVAAPIVITLLIVGVVIWAVRRSAPRHEDPAVSALKGRFARGEIDQAEFEVRLRSLVPDRD